MDYKDFVHKVIRVCDEEWTCVAKRIDNVPLTVRSCDWVLSYDGYLLLVEDVGASNRLYLLRKDDFQRVSVIECVATFLEYLRGKGVNEIFVSGRGEKLLRRYFSEDSITIFKVGTFVRI